MKEQVYNQDSIKSLSLVEHIRHRPSMYIGSIGLDGIHHLFHEILDNCVDEFLAGHATEIRIDLHKSGGIDIVSVEDNGRGIPHGVRKDGLTTLEAVFTIANTGGKFDADSYSTSAGTNGIGLKAVNALSSKLVAISTVNGKLLEFKSSNGKSKGVYESSANSDSKNGTIVTFSPDPDIFETVEFDPDLVKTRLFYLSSLLPGLKIIAKIHGEKFYYESKTALKSIQDKNLDSRDSIFSYSYISKEASLVLDYAKGSQPSIKSFCNAINTYEDGFHVDAVIDAISNSLKRLTGRSFTRSQITGGLCLTISVYGRDIIFRGQNKSRVADNKIRKLVYESIYDSLYQSLSKDKAFVKYLVELATQQEQVLEDIEIKKAVTSLKNSVRQNRLPANLAVANCSVDDRELFIVEGISAAGSLKRARNPKFQEVLPIKGKIINAFKSSYADLINNKEVLDLFLAVGSTETSGTPLRTKKVFIMSDADSDGCFTGDTKISLLDGTEIEIQNLVNDFEDKWVYSCKSDGTIVPGKIINAFETKKVTELLEITLDNGEVIKCTPDHRFMLRNGEYKRSYQLTVGESLMPLYKKYNESNYEELINNKTGNWEKTHNVVAFSIENSIKECRERLKLSGREKEHLVIHHVDFNRKNNNPANLKWMGHKEHIEYHSKNIKNNLWANPEFAKTARENINKYNKKGIHGEKISKLHKEGIYKDKSYFKIYNKTHNHSKIVSERNKKLWENNEYREKMSKILGESKDKETRSRDTQNQWKNPEIAFKMQFSMVANVINKCISIYGVCNKDLYDKTRGKNVPGWDTIQSKYNKTPNELIEFSKNYNHKIISIKKVILENPIPVYDITVDKYHNFALSAGVFVHNCHISALILSLFSIMYPSFVRQNGLYVVESPLFCITSGDIRIYGHNTRSLIAEFKKKHGNKSYHIMRNKGLGEMDAKDLAPCVDPKTRVIQKAVYSEDSISELNKLMGDISEVRQSLLEESDENI